MELGTTAVTAGSGWLNPRFSLTSESSGPIPSDSDDSSKRFHVDVEGTDKDVREGEIFSDDEGIHVASYLVRIHSWKSFHVVCWQQACYYKIMRVRVCAYVCPGMRASVCVPVFVCH